ncbi:MAG: hypothetical protein HYS07_07070 [Chlamydiae bacterium]|nr:hypothetical protein [Chlamydiota bacterium]MBI3276904.1 hypothetical protein [Chlamydiota bacterium]
MKVYTQPVTLWIGWVFYWEKTPTATRNERRETRDEGSKSIKTARGSKLEAKAKEKTKTEKVFASSLEPRATSQSEGRGRTKNENVEVF